MVAPPVSQDDGHAGAEPAGALELYDLENIWKVLEKLLTHEVEVEYETVFLVPQEYGSGSMKIGKYGSVSKLLSLKTMTRWKQA